MVYPQSDNYCLEGLSLIRLLLVYPCFKEGNLHSRISVQTPISGFQRLILNWSTAPRKTHLQMSNCLPAPQLRAPLTQNLMFVHFEKKNSHWRITVSSSRLSSTPRLISSLHSEIGALQLSLTLRLKPSLHSETSTSWLSSSLRLKFSLHSKTNASRRPSSLHDRSPHFIHRIYVCTEMKTSSGDGIQRSYILAIQKSSSKGAWSFHNTNKTISKQLCHFHYKIYTITFH